MRILPEVSVSDGGIYTVYVDKKKSVEAKKAFDALSNLGSDTVFKVRPNQ